MITSLCAVWSVCCFPYHIMHGTTVLIGSDLISILVSRRLCTRQRFKRHVKLSVTLISPLRKYLLVWQDSKAEENTGGHGMCISILKQAKFYFTFPTRIQNSECLCIGRSHVILRTLNTSTVMHDNLSAQLKGIHYSAWKRAAGVTSSNYLEGLD